MNNSRKDTVVQMVELLACDTEVPGSIPAEFSCVFLLVKGKEVAAVQDQLHCA